MGGVAVIATWTGVHRGNEHEGTGVLDVVLGTTDGNDTILQWLAKHLKDTA
jgi:hypothetical protein